VDRHLSFLVRPADSPTAIQRRITLPLSVDEDKVKVNFTDGVLRVAFEKHPVSRGITKKLAICT
jgi:HSP20 family molecular chaperone IbpA